MMNIPTATDFLEKLKTSIKIENYEDAVDNSIFWDRHLIIGDIDTDIGDSCESMIRFWNRIDDENNIPIEERKPIKIYIDSDGGDLGATFTIIDAICISKTPIYTINIGSAYSGGFFIYITGHKRFAYPKATFLYHEGSTGQIADAGKFQNYATFYKHQLEKLKNVTLEFTNISEELYESKRRDDWWFDVSEALELGVVDQVVEEFI